MKIISKPTAGHSGVQTRSVLEIRSMRDTSRDGEIPLERSEKATPFGPWIYQVFITSHPQQSPTLDLLKFLGPQNGLSSLQRKTAAYDDHS
jgi:hypothetical protein